MDKVLGLFLGGVLKEEFKSARTLFLKSFSFCARYSPKGASLFEDWEGKGDGDGNVSGSDFDSVAGFFFVDFVFLS